MLRIAEICLVDSSFYSRNRPPTSIAVADLGGAVSMLDCPICSLASPMRGARELDEPPVTSAAYAPTLRRADPSGRSSPRSITVRVS